MIPSKYLIAFASLILGVFHVYAQNNPDIISERTMYSKVFSKENGDREALISPSPMHYQKNGAWEDINTTLISGSDGYQNQSNVLRSWFPNQIDSTGSIKLIVNTNDEVRIHSEKKLLLLNEQNELSILPLQPNYPVAVVNANTINYPGIYSDISDNFSILNGQVKNNIVLNTVPALLNNISTGYFGFQEIMELPGGWKISGTGPSTNSLTSSSLLITDATGHAVMTIPAPVFFDNYGLKSDGSNMVEGKYLVEKENDRWLISTFVPVEWLKDANTTYPVSLDPTVIIVGTTGGWQSPNNFVDNPSFVFIGVCCSNLTHRAWIKFNISGIPTTSCITNVEIQPNVTSEANTVAEGVLINDVTGAFGPYGAINSAAYTDFGNGNYTNFTITTTGLYGYYSLGASANSLLQSQIPGGWFQVAFQFVNEPSTNYKIITATSSNLRVTYTAPPCVVLPIELVAFNAKCNKKKVDLTWTTASQLNNDHFSIERSPDGINYEIIGTVKGAGNSNETLQYTFTDAKPLQGTSYYRLKQTDFNRKSESFNAVAVNCNTNTELNIWPNPGAGIFNVEGTEAGDDLIITDVIGQIVYQSRVISEKTEIDLSYLNGIYFIQVVSKNGSVSKKIIITK